jgi:hypothetical protein
VEVYFPSFDSVHFSWCERRVNASDVQKAEKLRAFRELRASICLWLCRAGNSGLEFRLCLREFFLSAAIEYPVQLTNAGEWKENYGENWQRGRLASTVGA